VWSVSNESKGDSRQGRGTGGE